MNRSKLEDDIVLIGASLCVLALVIAPMVIHAGMDPYYQSNLLGAAASKAIVQIDTGDYKGAKDVLRLALEESGYTCKDTTIGDVSTVRCVKDR